MDAIERAIRSALERGDADERAFREKVYRSVFTALERNIAANPDLAADVAQRRREALKVRITQIEQEFQPALRTIAPAPPRQSPEAPPSIAPAPAVDPAMREPAPDIAPAASMQPEPEALEPSLGGQERDARRLDRAEPRFPDFAARGDESGFAPESGDFTPAPAADERMYDAEAAAERRRRPWAATFIAVTVLAALAIGGWWTVSTGLFGRIDTSVPNPPIETEEESFEPEAAAPLQPGTVEAERGWTTVFSPSDPVSVSAPANALADIMEEEGQSFIRIRSGAAGEPVVFDVGQGILERIAGRRAVFDVVVRAEEGRETQISIQCDFGGLGDCGRRRYLVGTHRADCLFDVELPAGRPDRAGTISIVSDVENAGKAIDIFEIRVSIAD